MERFFLKSLDSLYVIMERSVKSEIYRYMKLSINRFVTKKVAWQINSISNTLGEHVIKQQTINQMTPLIVK